MRLPTCRSGGREGNAPVSDTTASSAAPPARLVTFDCFDTAVTRAVGSPPAVAYFTGRRLRAEGVLDLDPAVFTDARVEAERRMLKRFGDRHTLQDIAREQADILGLPEEMAPALAAAELETEAQVSRAVPVTTQRVERVRATGATVAFLSDTSFPQEFVRGLLERHGVIAEGEQLWVSNELQAGKARGTAYFEVAKRLGGMPQDWRHVGDDARADGKFAKLSGVQPTLVTSARTNRYEETLEAARTATGGLSSVMAGASRRTRLVLEAEHPEIPRARTAVVAGVAAPLFAGYLLWCFRQAEQAGCKRLYFVARDGEALLAVARPLAEGLGLDLDLRYLEGSRRAWLLASMEEPDLDRIATVVGRGEAPTVRDCLEWLDIEPEQVREPLERAGYPPERWEEGLDKAGSVRVLTILQDPAAAALVREAGERRAGLVGDYLRQVGLLDGEPFAIVDLGWLGTVGRLLTATLRRFGGEAPAVECYLGLEGTPHDAPGRTPRGYVFDEWRGTGVVKTEREVYVALEMFVAATHGSVLGYERVDGAVRPVLASAENEPALAWGLRDMRAALEVFCRELAPTLTWADTRADVRRVTWDNLAQFWQTPTAAEVAAWGDFPFEDDNATHPIAEGYPTRQVLLNIARRRIRRSRRGTWPAGVRATAPVHLKVIDRTGDEVRDLARKARKWQGFVTARRR